MLQNPRPNLFLAGAPKCGTTAMAHYLSQHPDIFLPEIKEPHYFIRDDMPNKGTMSLERYLDLYKPARNEKYLLDASVWYLYGRKSIENIYRFNPDSKLIVMLRRPDEMVVSMHQQAYRGRGEDLADFEQAWHKIGKRKQNLEIPGHCREISLLFYDEIAKYAEQLERVYTIFDRKQVLAVFYDNFREDPEKVHLSLLEFLQIPVIPLQEYQVINPRKQIRSELLRNMTRRYPDSLARFVSGFKSRLGINYRLNILSRLRNLNQKQVSPAQISEKIRLEIVENYREDIFKLQEITGKNLSSWLE